LEKNRWESGRVCWNGKGGEEAARKSEKEAEVLRNGEGGRIQLGTVIKYLSWHEMVRMRKSLEREEGKRRGSLNYEKMEEGTWKWNSNTGQEVLETLELWRRKEKRLLGTVRKGKG
jgi:hypothetical protein